MVVTLRKSGLNKYFVNLNNIKELKKKSSKDRNKNIIIIH